MLVEEEELEEVSLVVLVVEVEEVTLVLVEVDVEEVVFLLEVGVGVGAVTVMVVGEMPKH